MAILEGIYRLTLWEGESANNYFVGFAKLLRPRNQDKTKTTRNDIPFKGET
jgi:hypothetical protein